MNSVKQLINAIENKTQTLEASKPLTQSQIYYKNNKDILQTKYKERIECPLCKKEMAKASLGAHMKTGICSKRIDILRKQNAIKNSV